MSTEINVTTEESGGLVSRAKAEVQANRFAALQKQEQKAVERKVAASAAPALPEEIIGAAVKKENDLSAARSVQDIEFALLDSWETGPKAVSTYRESYTRNRRVWPLVLVCPGSYWLKEQITFDTIITRYENTKLASFCTPGAPRLREEFGDEPLPAWVTKIAGPGSSTPANVHNHWSIEWGDPSRSLIRKIRYRHEDAPGIGDIFNPNTGRSSGGVIVYVRCQRPTFVRLQIKETAMSRPKSYYNLTPGATMKVYLENNLEGNTLYVNPRLWKPPGIYGTPSVEYSQTMIYSTYGMSELWDMQADPGRNHYDPFWEVAKGPGVYCDGESPNEGYSGGGDSWRQLKPYSFAYGGTPFPMSGRLFHNVFDPTRIVWSPDPEQEVAQRYYNEVANSEPLSAESWSYDSGLLCEYKPPNLFQVTQVGGDADDFIYDNSEALEAEKEEIMKTLGHKKSSVIATIRLDKGINKLSVSMLDGGDSFGAEAEIGFDFAPLPNMLRPPIPSRYYPS